MWVLLALLAAAGTATGEEETPDTWDGKQFVKASEADQIPEPKINIPGLETDSKMARLNEQVCCKPHSCGIRAAFLRPASVARADVQARPVRPCAGADGPQHPPPHAVRRLRCEGAPFNTGWLYVRP